MSLPTCMIRVTTNNGITTATAQGVGQSTRTTSRRFRGALTTTTTNTVTRTISNKLDLDFGFFWLLLAFLITTFMFLSVRDYHSLNSTQLAEYERRTQYLSNSTVYIVEAMKSELLLSKLSAEEWKHIGRDIDVVAFVFDDLPLFLNDEWISVVEEILTDKNRIEMISFHCGCVLPSAYFMMTNVRMNGLECILLPGFVLDEQNVKWIEADRGELCRGRERIIGTRGMALEWSDQLAELKEKLEKVQPLQNKTT